MYDANKPCVQLLVRRGADAKAVNNDGQTPLHKAAASGSVSVLRLPLDSGPTMDRKDRNGKTALRLAVEEWT
jgi:ankyrin repeat protein